MTAWTSDSGASAIAPTWRIQAPAATSMPIANHLERKRPTALRERVAQLDVRGGAGAAVLEQEAQVGEERAEKREKDA